MITRRMDKAANCLCVICKGCCVQLVTEEMEVPGYSRVEREGFASIMSAIVKRQWDFLRQKFPYPSCT